jgi:F-type H+-transporting ATPase subunit delta
VPSSDLPKIIAGEQAVLARRYAAAVFELAQEQGVMEPVEADLRALQEAIDSNPLFHVMATHPRLPHHAIQTAVKNIIEGSHFHALTAAFLRQIARGRRLAYLSLIIEIFKNRLADMRREQVAVVTVAQKITSAQEAQLAAQLGRMTGGSVRLVIEEDAALIGGMTVKIGSRLIDASLQGKLARLERRLKSQQEAA